jgi:hypothetical protein
MTIIYRSNGPWGAGKGSLLTAAEVDGNFFDLVGRIVDLEENGIEPNNIFQIDVVNNALVITMTDLSTYGPFPLPVAAFRWTDEYQAGFNYQIYDLFTSDDGMYMVRVAHTSATEFDPEESDTEGDYYQLIFPYPTTYDIGFFFPGAPGYGVAFGSAMFASLAIRSFYIPADAVLSRASLHYAPTDAVTYPIYKNNSEIGSVFFDADSTDGVFTFPDAVQFAPGDKLRVLRPEALDSFQSEGELDLTARDLTITFRALKGTL